VLLLPTPQERLTTTPFISLHAPLLLHRGCVCVVGTRQLVATPRGLSRLSLYPPTFPILNFPRPRTCFAGKQWKTLLSPSFPSWMHHLRSESFCSRPRFMLRQFPKPTRDEHSLTSPYPLPRLSLLQTVRGFELVSPLHTFKVVAVSVNQDQEKFI